MATLASRSKQLSGLASGTLAQHLAAITQGAAAGRYIFARQFSVQITAPCVFAVQRPKREAQESKRSVAPVVSGDRQGGGNVSILARPNTLWVMTGRDELFIHQTNSSSIAVTDFGQERLTVRQNDVIEFN